MTDTDLDFIEANQVMQAVDERLEKLYWQRAQIATLHTAVRNASPYLTAEMAEDDQAVRALESAKRKLSVRWYSEVPDQPVTANR